MGKYLLNLLISLDQLVNTLTGGDPDETISSRAGKATRRNSGPWRLLCRILHIFDPAHCEKSIEHDEGKDAIYQDNPKS